VSPSSGPAVGSTKLTVSGTSLGATDDPPPLVRICGVAATEVKPHPTLVGALLATTEAYSDAVTGEERTGTNACPVRVTRSDGRYDEAGQVDQIYLCI